ncbi:Uncharacterised protein [Mycobacterium xenopi]|uniref:Uncharacterized protein n=1 Tax=Mycobacterium xenopi TaxID=1789 RepID=A0AAD1H3U0_MYCXE|nr:hypothetical protein MYXE_40910 [Mycobacterium xenopi]SPX90395.1 Uncharacterised protein [Mycobacterium xenopi]
MLAASMPEAAVDENCDLLSCERYIDCAAPHTGDRVMHTVAQSSSVQKPTQINLGTGVAARVPAHLLRHLSRRWDHTLGWH